MNALLLVAAFVCDTPSKPLAEVDLGKPLNEKKTVFLDASKKRLWLKTTVARDTGVLEMFLCKKGTKEHESVVAVDSPAFVIHAGLLALGLEPGSPATFSPEYAPPKGPKLDINVYWTDKNGKRQSRPASDWIRHATQRWFTIECDAALAEDVTIPDDLDLRYIKADNELLWFGPMSDEQLKAVQALSSMPGWNRKAAELQKRTKVKTFEGQWVFAGSAFWVDERSKERQYLAESGNLICVANFGDAMIDIDAKSSAENASLLYEPWTERVPSPGTPVLVEIRKADQD